MGPPRGAQTGSEFRIDGRIRRRIRSARRIRAAIAALDSKSLKLIRKAPTRGDAIRVYESRAGELIVSNLANDSLSFFTPELTEIAHLPLGGKPIGLSFHSQLPIAYVSVGPDLLVVLDLPTRKVAGEFKTRAGVDLSALVPRRA